MKPYFAIIVLLVVASVSVAGGLDIGVVTDIDAAGKRLTVVLENDGAITFGKKREDKGTRLNKTACLNESRPLVFP